MGFENLYGIGKGQAQILPQNQGLQYLQQQMAQERQRKEQEDAQAQATLQKLDYSKTRDADVNHFIEGYQDIQNTYNQLREAKDPTQRIVLNNALQQKQKDFMHRVSLSQQAMDNEKSFLTYGQQHTDKVKDDYLQNARGLTGTSVFDPKYKQQLEYFNDPLAPQFAQTDYEKKLLPSALTPVKGNGQIITKTLPDGTKQYQQENGNDVSYDKVLTQLHSDYLLNPKSGVKQYVNQLATKNNITPDKALEMYAKDIQTRYQPQYGSDMGTPKAHFVNPQKDDSQWYAHEAWKLAHKADAKANEPTYVQDLGERLRAEAPTNSDKALQEFGALVSANPAYLHGIKQTKLPDGKIQLEIPARMKYSGSDSGDGTPKGRIVEKPAYKEVLDPKDVNLFNAKFSQIYRDITGDQNAAPAKALTIYGKGKVPGGMSKFTAPTGGQSKTTKTVSMEKINGLVGKPGYEGYNAKELADYYTSQGYKIQ